MTAGRRRSDGPPPGDHGSRRAVPARRPGAGLPCAPRCSPARPRAGGRRAARLVHRRCRRRRARHRRRDGDRVPTSCPRCRPSRCSPWPPSPRPSRWPGRPSRARACWSRPRGRGSASRSCGLLLSAARARRPRRAARRAGGRHRRRRARSRCGPARCSPLLGALLLLAAGDRAGRAPERRLPRLGARYAARPSAGTPRQPRTPSRDADPDRAAWDALDAGRGSHRRAATAEPPERRADRPTGPTRRGRTTTPTTAAVPQRIGLVSACRGRSGVPERRGGPRGMTQTR